MYEHLLVATDGSKLSASSFIARVGFLHHRQFSSEPVPIPCAGPSGLRECSTA